MRENDEITGLFRSRLAGAEMTVREDFWEGLQRDLPSPVAAKGRRLLLSPRFHRVAAAASVVFVLGAASAAFWYFPYLNNLRGHSLLEGLVMLYKHHRWGKHLDQLLNLHTGVQVNIIKRLIPYIQMRLFAQAPCNQHFFLLPARKL